MSDLIYRHEAIKTITSYNGAVDKSVAKRLLLQMPSAERKKGKWIADVDRWGDVETTVNGYICSECKVFNTDKDNYCPNCGCQMKGGEQDDTD